MAGILIQGRPVDGSSGSVASSSAGGPLVVTLTATAGNKRWHIQELLWSVDAAPSSQTLTVYSGTSSGSRILEVEIGSSGHDGMFLPPLRASANSAATVVLSSGSTGGVRLNVLAYQDD